MKSGRVVDGYRDAVEADKAFDRSFQELHHAESELNRIGASHDPRIGALRKQVQSELNSLKQARAAFDEAVPHPKRAVNGISMALVAGAATSAQVAARSATSASEAAVRAFRSGNTSEGFGQLGAAREQLKSQTAAMRELREYRDQLNDALHHSPHESKDARRLLNMVEEELRALKPAIKKSREAVAEAVRASKRCDPSSVAYSRAQAGYQDALAAVDTIRQIDALSKWPDKIPFGGAEVTNCPPPPPFDRRAELVRILRGQIANARASLSEIDTMASAFPKSQYIAQLKAWSDATIAYLERELERVDPRVFDLGDINPPMEFDDDDMVPLQSTVGAVTATREDDVEAIALA
jgi:hypothetical protein